MFLVDKIAEEKIQQAMAEGKFDNLSTRGKPYRMDGYLYQDPEIRVVTKVLRDHNYLPEVFYLRKKIEELEARLEALSEQFTALYGRLFSRLVEQLALEPGYPPEQFHRHLDRHRRFLTLHLKIWLDLRASSSLRELLEHFHRQRSRFRDQYLSLQARRAELVDLHNQEVLRQTLKERDRFRIRTTLGRVSLQECAERFDTRFPALPRVARPRSALF
ncbi:MAG: DUF1992 domain-containing protein [Calditrichaeota bacterium]|nr:MAG: DUF1992 domain-containing protein [Calditrichota bacterium]